MSEQISAAEKEAETQIFSLSRKKRMALISYLAILFIVALAVVTLSLVIQIHRSTSENVTFAEKAQTLQEENQELMERGQNIRSAYDWLLRAKDAYDAKEEDSFVSAMNELEPLQEYLSGYGQETYNLLLEAFEQIQGEPQTTGN